MPTVLITGAGRGIGLKLAETFLNSGYEVIATVRSKDGAERLQSMADALSQPIDIVNLEVTSAESVAALVEQLGGRTVDILVNNAGIIGSDQQSFSDLNFDDWLHTFEVNTLAPMRVALALLPNIQQSQNGKIVNISSIMGSLAHERTDMVAYRSSKAALNKAMLGLAVELKSQQIGVYLMHPGWVQTDMGGANADISVEQSAAGLFSSIEHFTLEHSGRFWNYDGTEMDW